MADRDRGLYTIGNVLSAGNHIGGLNRSGLWSFEGDVLAKFLIWAVTLSGLMPSMILTVLTASALRTLAASPAVRRYGGRAFMHDTYVTLQFRSLTLSLYPRVWSLVLISLGCVAVIVGLVFVLHVPNQK